MNQNIKTAINKKMRFKCYYKMLLLNFVVNVNTNAYGFNYQS